MSELFRATYRGRPVVIGQASAEELFVITRDVDTAACRDCLERWTLVAIRDPGRPQVRIHALGWRSTLQNTWITSRLVAVDTVRCAVSTMSGHVYRLEQARAGDPEPELRSHLQYALHQWGFEDVQDPGLRSGASGRSQERTSGFED